MCDEAAKLQAAPAAVEDATCLHPATAYNGFAVTRPLRSFVALVLIAHLLTIVAMAACPHWHEEAHHDADEREHECAVTLFRSGAADDSAHAPVLTAVTLTCVEVVRMEAAHEVFLARVEGRIRERAPPGEAV